MRPVEIILLALLAVDFAIHMKDSYRNDFPKRVRTKIWLVPLILAWYLVASPAPNGYLVAALIASWVGDILLMPSGDKWFVYGGIAFLLAHGLFILSYLPRDGALALQGKVLLPVLPVYLLAIAFVFSRVWKPTPKLMRVPMVAYLLMNTAMNLFALNRVAVSPDAGSVLAYIGAILFFCSDSCLFLSDYGGWAEKLRHYFYVMLTYVPAMFLITLGMYLG